MDEIKDRLLKPSKATKQDQRGRMISYLSIGLIAILVISILYFIATRGLSMFFNDGIKVSDFLFKTDWNPGKKLVGALPMIVTSFGVTLLAALIATPFAIAVALFMTEFAPKRGARFLQVVIELLVGIPSVIYGLIGLAVVVPAMRITYGGTGFGILAGAVVLFVMVLPTITSLTVDALKAVPSHYRQASLALGATRWQTIYKVILRAATPGILTAVVFGMARAFGEALAVQMVIGNAAMLPHNLVSPSATLTSQLTMGIGNTIMGTLPNNALWSLALLLLIMALVFNILVKLIARKGRIK
ncbi:phosphate ABC transporter permease subunit PstC [Paucilactobacillus nenjiangensis]|uniref:Phosphate transport system permease protein n=1 Tax=Paucilactobacillus nenjiangensis TaxID=1296540 RepID=A0A5P1WZX2_9LACO|nr:phosphate ABC transporter permease subunit PstC [Paucilactobacillus nenjiangensis]QER67180.1 phosphate ABC transporter permease subunit PstC [Paucilactobacillus nenjiangensis]